MGQAYQRNLPDFARRSTRFGAAFGVEHHPCAGVAAAFVGRLDRYDSRGVALVDLGGWRRGATDRLTRLLGVARPVALTAPGAL